MPAPDRLRRVAACLLACCLLLSPAAGDEDADARLEEVEQAIADAAAARAALDDEARAVAEELDGLRERLLGAETAMRAQESVLAEIAVTLEALEEELALRRAALDLRRDEFALVLAALQRIARQPAEMLLAMPTSPTDTHRTAMLLASLTPELDRRAAEIAAEIAGLVEVEAQIDGQLRSQAATLEALAAERAIAAAATIRKRELFAGLHRQDEVLAAEQDRLAEEALDLRDLIDGLTRDASSGDAAMSGATAEALAATSFSAQRGSLALPVAGTISAQFGATIGDGVASEGIYIAAAPGARVVTPYDGQVVYSGPFREYGHLLIIDHGEGYHTVLAGFARADVVLGQWLLAGEPVGAMAQDEAGNRPLYVELRRNGETINPLPWLAAGAEEVTGG